MGEYYNWINVDKKEFICPGDFRCGDKAHGAMWRKFRVMDALHDLLANEWKGCHIFWMGDECDFPKNTGLELFDTLWVQTEETGYPGNMLEAVIVSYTNKSGLFKGAEKDVSEEIEFQLNKLKDGDELERNEYGIDFENPYEGLFLRDGKEFKYTINYTKKVCYSFEETLIYREDGSLTDELDPLPMLMGYGLALKPGEWLGDIIGVSDSLPEGVTIIDEIHLDM